MKSIITHNSLFHADEVTAVALLKVFSPYEFTIERVPHQTPDLEADFVIDIGREFDGKTKFDHHQYTKEQNGLSSAGMIYAYCKDKYDVPDMPVLDKLIKLIDDNDIGVAKAAQFSVPHTISMLNGSDVHDDSTQIIQFNSAVELMETIIITLTRNYRELENTKATVEVLMKERTEWHKRNHVLELPEYLSGWQDVVNTERYPTIRCVMYPSNKFEEDIEYSAQMVPDKAGSYNFVHDGFNPDVKMVFVHSGKFFCVAKSKANMRAYLTI